MCSFLKSHEFTSCRCYVVQFSSSLRVLVARWWLRKDFNNEKNLGHAQKNTHPDWAGYGVKYVHWLVNGYWWELGNYIILILLHEEKKRHSIYYSDEFFLEGILYSATIVVIGYQEENSGENSWHMSVKEMGKIFPTHNG